MVGRAGRTEKCKKSEQHLHSGLIVGADPVHTLTLSQFMLLFRDILGIAPTTCCCSLPHTLSLITTQVLVRVQTHQQIDDSVTVFRLLATYLQPFSPLLCSPPPPRPLPPHFPPTSCPHPRSRRPSRHTGPGPPTG